VAVSGFSALMVLLVAQAAPAPEPKSPAEVRAAFVKMLDRPKVPLDVRNDPTILDEKKGLTVERLSFASEKKADGTIERVPVLVVRPSKSEGRRPAVIALHGTGGTKEGMRGLLEELAKKGFVAIAIDARYHGDRAGGAKGASAYVEAITRAWRAKPGEAQEHPFYYDTCWDLWRTVDYLASRDDVDPARIGMIGISMGGIETWLAASADERIAVAVPAISVQSFRWSLDHEAWQGRAATIKGAHDAAAKDLDHERVDAEVCRALWNKIIPGILGPFDCPNMVRLFAGRPLLIVNGEKDPNCPIGGSRVAFEAAERAFKGAGASEKLRIMVAPGVAHAVTAEQHAAALNWFVRWLKP
jgi:dienelactone hydrolase